jgi:hypothetical protein
MTAVIPPGKKRGYFEARFRGNVFAVVADRGRAEAPQNRGAESGGGRTGTSTYLEVARSAQAGARWAVFA